MKRIWQMIELESSDLNRGELAAGARGVGDR